MLRKIIILAIFVLFVGASVVSAFNINLVNESKPMNHGNWLYVGGSTSENYSKIQDAIDNANEGDTVFVYDDSSPYYENLIVNKTINLLGEDKNTTVIDGNRSGDIAFITADNVLISGFTITKSRWGNYSGIKIKSNRANISGNIIFNNYIGISIYDSSINTILYNTISDNWVGIIISNSSNNTISDNIIEFNGDNDIIINSSNNNSINGNNMSGGSFKSIFLNSANNNTIFNNNITESKYGLYLDSSNNNTIIGNNIWTCTFGIHLKSSSKNIFSNNNMFHIERGIYLDHSKSNNITSNSIDINFFGIVSSNSSENNILYNNFFWNFRNAFFTGFSSNNWDGNYWTRPRLLPKPIFGITKIGSLPYLKFDFDWHPAKKPYKNMEVII